MQQDRRIGDERAPARVLARDQLECALGELSPRRGVRRTERLCGAGKDVDRLGVARLSTRGELFGNLHRRRTRAQELVDSLPLKRPPRGGRHALQDRPSQEVVAEGQPVAVLHQEISADQLRDRVEQIRRGSSQHVGDSRRT